MIGVVLAGGNGTRLHPLTTIVNKHLLPVYNQPMIDYPIQTLRVMGCDDIIIVSGGNHIGGLADYLGSGYTYRVQDTANGVAGALQCVRGLVSGLFPVILGDNYFDEAPEMPTKPTIYTRFVKDAKRFGTLIGKTIVEKPDVPDGDAVTGLYVYDEQVFHMIPTLTPSKRNELEITDINNMYLTYGDMKVVKLKSYWRDMGTFESLLEVANYVKEQQ